MNLAVIIGLALQASIFVTVLGFGMQANLDDALYLFRRPALLVRAILAMNVIMPLFVGLLIALFRFDPVINVSLVALAVSPVPPILPNKAFNEGGSKSYTLGLLTALSLLSIVIVPLAIEIFERAFNHPATISAVMVARNVFIGVVLPLALGITIHYFAPAFAERIGSTVVKIGMIILAIAALPVIIALLPAIWSLIGNGTILAIAAFVIVGLTVGHFLGGPDPNDRTVLAISTATRHPGIAIAIASAGSIEPKLASAAVFLYLIVSGIIATPYLNWLKRDNHVETRNAVKT